MGSLNYVAPMCLVSDLPRSVAYYQGKWGFELVFNCVGLVRDGCRIHLKYVSPVSRGQAKFEEQEHIDVCLEAQGLQAPASEFATAGG